MFPLGKFGVEAMGPWCEKVQSEWLNQFEQKMFEITGYINAKIFCAKNMIQRDSFVRVEASKIATKCLKKINV